ncbi:MAG: orotidine-5'-phosphate decarboxylase [Desulfohalobiaceae bacterium]
MRLEPEKPCNQGIELRKRIICALDLPQAEQARDWVRRLGSRVGFYKVGWELFLAAGWDIVHWIFDQGHEVMLDLKLYDVPRTVGQAMQQAARHPVSLATVHGNQAILQAAQQKRGQCQVLAVTVLTSLDQEDLTAMGLPCSPRDLVLHRAIQALAAGCAGVVCSGQELPLLRQNLGQNFLAVVPGVRPQQELRDDQKRVVSVEQAFAQGADHVVLGRPLREAQDPLELLDSLQQDIQQQLQKAS